MLNNSVQTFFGVFIAFKIICSNASFDFFLDDFETHHNPIYMKDFKLWVDNNKIDHTKYRVNMEVNLSNVGYVFLHIKMYEREKKNGPPTTKILDFSIDVCRAFAKNRKSDIFYKFFLDIMYKYGKMPTSCPVKDDFYYFYNLTLQSVPFPMVSSFKFGPKVRYGDLSFIVYKKEKRNMVVLTNVTYIGGLYIS